MKKIASVIIAVALFSSLSFGQEEVHRHSSGPRRQLATIVFAGLGGAILGLSTLSFYGRPQDQLSNIAIGFAVGIIAGTTYVTIRSATTRDYLDKTDTPQSSLNVPTKLETLAEVTPDPEPAVIYAPLLTRVTPESLSYGGTLAFRF